VPCARQAAGFAAAFGLVMAAWPGSGHAQTAAEVLADQVRQQGQACERALGAERDEAASRPELPVWILRCSNASYRVRLVPDMAARIERLP